VQRESYTEKLFPALNYFFPDKSSSREIAIEKFKEFSAIFTHLIFHKRQRKKKNLSRLLNKRPEQYEYQLCRYNSIYAADP
jgi:hypothetical protein